MKFLTLTLAAVFVFGPAWLYAQVETERRGISSPFAVYEDASLMEPGTFTIGLYNSFSRTGAGNSFSAPGIDFSLGLHQRFELSGFGSVGYSRDDHDRLRAERDDSYLGLKVLLLPEARRLPAVAIKPTLELLSGASGTDRAHLMLPVILQKDTWFGDLAFTAGYVTRGIAFSSLKCEWGIGSRITPMAVVYASRITKDLRAISELGLNRTQIDGSAGVNIDISPRWSVFLVASRTFSRRDENSSHFDFTASIAYTGRVWGRKGNGHRKHIAVRH